MIGMCEPLISFDFLFISVFPVVPREIGIGSAPKKISREEKVCDVPPSRLSSPDSTPPMSVEPPASPPPTTGGEEIVVNNKSAVPQSRNNTESALDEAYLDNEMLENLFDRLCALKQEESAIRMGDILRRYEKPGDPNCGVNVIDLPESYPMVIHMDLRKLPLPCIFELTELVLADEKTVVSSSR